MDKNKLWTIGCVLVMAVVLIVGVLLGIQPQLVVKATANEQRQSVAATNAGQSAVLAQLEKDFAGIDDLKADLEPLRDSVPTTTDVPAFVNQLTALSGRSQVVLTGITVSDATAYTPVEAPAAVEEEPGSTATPAPDGVVVAPTAGVPPVTSDQITAANFVSLSVTVAVTGTYGNALDFVKGLQSGERLVLVSGISTTAEADTEGDASSDNVTALITGLVYVLVPAATAETTDAG
ncbi:hypothetical protein [Cryobacterium sp. AP23]